MFIFVSSFFHQGLTGQCYMFLRASNSKAVTTANIAQVQQSIQWFTLKMFKKQVPLSL